MLFEDGYGLADLLLEVATHEIKHFPDERIADRIEDLIGDLARSDDLASPQYGEVLRDVGLLRVEALGEDPNCQGTVAQFVDDGNPGGISQSLKYLCFELAE